MRYLAQDFLCNGLDQFIITVQSRILPIEAITDVNASLRYESFDNGVLATARIENSSPAIAVVIHFKPKIGEASENIDAIFLDQNRFQIAWKGIRRLFVRVRIMETTTVEALTQMLRDDIQSGHSISDIEDPDIDHSFRPWSDQDDSETDTIDDEE